MPFSLEISNRLSHRFEGSVLLFAVFAKHRAPAAPPILFLHESKAASTWQLGCSFWRRALVVPQREVPMKRLTVAAGFALVLLIIAASSIYSQRGRMTMEHYNPKAEITIQGAIEKLDRFEPGTWFQSI